MSRNRIIFIVILYFVALSLASSIEDAIKITILYASVVGLSFFLGRRVNRKLD